MTGFATRTWEGITIPAAGTYQLDPAHKRIGFVARHMMVSPVRGEFAEAGAIIRVAEDPRDSAVTATIQAASITTGNPDRDAHLSSPDFLDVTTYPTLEYRSTGIQRPEESDPIFFWARLRHYRRDRRAATPALADPVPARPGGAPGFVLTGDLSIRGVTRQVDLQVAYGGARRDPYGRDIFGFHATAEINREDFGLVWNVALDSGGFLVGKDVRIEIAGEAIRQT